MELLVVASTVPAHEGDTVPRFVLDQALAFAEADPDVRVRVLAPHTPASRTLTWPRAESADGRVVQDRFRYAFGPLETLTERGIMPALSRHKALIAVVPALIACEAIAVTRAVKARRPDAIYAHWFMPQAVVVHAVARRRRVPFGYTTHASDVAVMRRLGRWGERIVRTVTTRAAFVTAVSRQTADKLLGFFDGAARSDVAGAMLISPMGIDVEPSPRPTGDARTVAVIARLVEKKGVHVLLEAWTSVKERVPDATLVIGGDGPWRARLEAQAATLKGVEFCGYVTGDAKRAVEDRAGIVAIPSVVGADGDSDGLTVAGLEALARGAAVVASDASGLQEMMGDADEVVPAGDAAALADALVTAMEMDDDERARRADAGRALASQVAWDKVAPEVLDRIRAAVRGAA